MTPTRTWPEPHRTEGKPEGKPEKPQDGREPREPRARLLDAGLRLFAAQGFAKTSTRELAEAAGVNVAAISYYFGDKAGLYRAVFLEPMGGSAQDDIERFANPALGLREALDAFYTSFLEPLMQAGDSQRLCMKLHYREMLEPTGLWDEEVAHGIKPSHEALVEVLARQPGLGERDAELHRLAVSLAGLAVHLHVARDVIDQIAPAIPSEPRQYAIWRERLVMYGLAMVQAEQQRRAAAAAPAGAAA
jgi:TetR/AcrR family transcriptional regulator, regulator of cefoperazone and chloramphenicol sensitivity